MRAVWYNLPKWDIDAENPLEKGKAEWKEGFKSKLDDLAYKEAIGKLPVHLVRHPAYEVRTLFFFHFESNLTLFPFRRSISFIYLTQRCR
jgi:hypothetical protein